MVTIALDDLRQDFVDNHQEGKGVSGFLDLKKYNKIKSISSFK